MASVLLPLFFLSSAIWFTFTRFGGTVEFSSRPLKVPGWSSISSAISVVQNLLWVNDHVTYTLWCSKFLGTTVQQVLLVTLYSGLYFSVWDVLTLAVLVSPMGSGGSGGFSYFSSRNFSFSYTSFTGIPDSLYKRVLFATLMVSMTREIFARSGGTR